MEFLDIEPLASGKGQRIPYLPFEGHTFPASWPFFGAFFDFPKSHNISCENLGDLLQLPPSRLAEVLQTWLFFGLLANIIGRISRTPNSFTWKMAVEISMLRSSVLEN